MSPPTTYSSALYGCSTLAKQRAFKEIECAGWTTVFCRLALVYVIEPMVAFILVNSKKGCLSFYLSKFSELVGSGKSV